MAAQGVRAAEMANVDVLVPSARSRRDAQFVRVHRTRRMPDKFHPVGPIRYVPMARAVIDTARLARELGEVRGIVAGPVQQGKVRVADLAKELAAGPPNASALLRHVLGEVADGVRSAAEAGLRTLIK